ncbi:MAG TPA: deoxyribodipyrimidine photolyase, partial [Candidatus Poseidoniales archaeon]
MVHDHDGYSSIPEWAQATLAEHANDPRPGGYTFEQLEAAETGDALW